MLGINSIKSKITVVFLISLAILMTAIQVYSVNNIKELASGIFDKSMQTELSLTKNILYSNYKNSWHYSGGELFLNDRKIKNSYDLINNIGEGLDTDNFLIFDKKGKLKIGTNINPEQSTIKTDGNVTKSLLKKSGTNYGKLTIDDEKYRGVYQSIEDDRGNVVGMMVVCRNDNELVNSTTDIIANTILFCTLGFSIIYFILNLILGKILIPLFETTAMLKDIAKGNGDLTKRIIVTSKDEVGELGKYFNDFIIKIQNIVKDVNENITYLTEASEKLLNTSEVIATNSEETSTKTELVSNTFEEIDSIVYSNVETITDTSQNSKEIADSIENISATVSKLALVSAQTSLDAEQVAGGINRISNTIDNVSTSAGEVYELINDIVLSVKHVNLWINNISTNCENSIDITENAVNQGEVANKAIDELCKYSKNIDKVIKVINDIADQTNMLALNAAIQAASSGASGKGFAVVANEVKELAKQTSEATEQISKQVANMQLKISSVTNAVEAINNIIIQTKEITSEIAQAVVEQSARTGQISKAVFVTANKVNLITEEINDLAKSSKEVKAITINASDGIKEIATSTSEISISSSKISSNADSAYTKLVDIVKMSNEILESVSEVHSNTQDINNSARDNSLETINMTDSARNLSNVAKKLQDIVSQFKI